MSFLESMIPFMPSTMRGISQITSGVSARRTAEASADRLEDIGRTEAQLRRIQAAKLLGQVRASFGGRGVVGGDVTSADLESEAAYLEGIDVARAQFRFTSLADQVRRTGQAAFQTGVVGGVSSVFDLARDVNVSDRIAAIEDANEAAELEQSAKKFRELTSAPTILGPRARTEIGAPIGAGELNRGIA